MSKHKKPVPHDLPEESFPYGEEASPAEAPAEEIFGGDGAEPPEFPREEPLPDTDFERPFQDTGLGRSPEDMDDKGAPDAGEAAPEPVQIPPDPVTQELPAPTEAAKPKGDRGMVIFGGIVLLFAVFGLICSIVLTTKGIHKLMEKPNQDGEYEWLLTPLVLQDPPQFASPDKVTDSTLITAGVWRLIMNEDVSKYPIDSMNFITVPASDIEVQIKALFGDVGYTHQSVGDTELLIIYDEANRTYEFPAVPHVLAYTPDVEEIVEEDEDTLLVTVGYIPPGPVWQKDTSGNSYQPAAEKQMTYTLKKAADGSWRVYAMGSVGGQEGQYPGDFGPVYPDPPAVPDNTPGGISPETSGEEGDAPDASSEEAETDPSSEEAEDGGASGEESSEAGGEEGEEGE